VVRQETRPILRIVTKWTAKRRHDGRTAQPVGVNISARSIARDMTRGSARVATVNAILATASPALIEARSLIDQPHAMMGTRKPESLAARIKATSVSNIAAFAARIETD
jgi:hypothetical protein